MSTITKRDAVEAAMSVAEEVANGKISPADLERQAVRELSALMAAPAEPGTNLHDLQIDVARRVLARGALSADEVSEWTAVARRRENPDVDTDSEAVATVVALEPADDPDVPPDEDSDDSEAHSPGNEAVDADGDVPEQEPEPEGCVKCAPAPIRRGPKFGGTVLAVGRGLPDGGGPVPI